MSTKSISPSKEVYFTKVPQKSNKEKQLNELNKKIRQVEEKFFSFIKELGSETQKISTQLKLLGDVADKNQDSQINQKIKTLNDQFAAYHSKRESLWEELASLYDKEAILTGNPSRSGRKKEEYVTEHKRKG